MCAVNVCLHVYVSAMFQLVLQRDMFQSVRWILNTLGRMHKNKQLLLKPVSKSLRLLIGRHLK